ncbi:hypothetical protein GCM10019016_081360 [Streptomyces prasinosporus]|uniref:Uncharacterized protein n=1 Tax=Streptomyces prasinosporus TaxID=68256 RepID=A0ABP6U0Z5_9ACTN|nr:hypothetical protein GCM10010332_51580 [Streptomyces albogriseolus]
MALPIDERAVLAEWIAAQHARIPAARARHREIADHLGKVLIAMGGKPEIRKRREESAAEPVPEKKVGALWEALQTRDERRPRSAARCSIATVRKGVTP